MALTNAEKSLQYTENLFIDETKNVRELSTLTFLVKLHSNG